MARRPKASARAAPTTGLQREAARTIDVLIVSLGATAGLRAADDELLGSLRRAGAHAEMARADRPAPVRTLMLTDLRWALAARRAALGALERAPVRAIVYSSSTAALLWPRRGAIRFDALAAGNRPGRHGLWQRPLERRRLRQAPLLLPWSDGGLDEAGGAVLPSSGDRSLVLPVPVEPSLKPGALAEAELNTPSQSSMFGAPESQLLSRDVAAVAYVTNPTKKGLEVILEAWGQARKPPEELVLAGASEGTLRELGYSLPAEGVQVLPMLPYGDYRALLRRARVFVSAARREDYGIAQLEALADGCMLVTTVSPGPYVALPIARTLDPRLVGDNLACALRIALDEPDPGYASQALRALEPLRRATLDRLVSEELLPRLLNSD